MPKRELYGVVVSAKNNSTVSVEVERKFRHPLYQKIVKRTKKYSAHDAGNKCKVGDKVKIAESKPISKTKTWLVITD